MTINNNTTNDKKAFKRILKAMLDAAIANRGEYSIDYVVRDTLFDADQDIKRCREAFGVSHDELQGYINSYTCSYNKYHINQITKSFNTMGFELDPVNELPAEHKPVNEVVCKEFIANLMYRGLDDNNDIIPTHPLNKTVTEKCLIILDNYNDVIVTAQKVCNVDTEFILETVSEYLEKYDYEFNWSNIDLSSGYNNSDDLDTIKKYQSEELSIKDKILSALVFDVINPTVANFNAPINKNEMLRKLNYDISYRLHDAIHALCISEEVSNDITERCLGVAKFDIDFLNRKYEGENNNDK